MSRHSELYQWIDTVVMGSPHVVWTWGIGNTCSET